MEETHCLLGQWVAQRYWLLCPHAVMIMRSTTPPSIMSRRRGSCGSHIRATHDGTEREPQEEQK